MNPKRKAARDRLMAVRTKSELAAILDELNITDEEREMATMVISRGWSYTKVSLELKCSRSHVARRMEKVYTKLC